MLDDDLLASVRASSSMLVDGMGGFLLVTGHAGRLAPQALSATHLAS